MCKFTTFAQWNCSASPFPVFRMSWSGNGPVDCEKYCIKLSWKFSLCCLCTFPQENGFCIKEWILIVFQGKNVQSFLPFHYDQNFITHIGKERLVRFYWEQLFLLCWTHAAYFNIWFVDFSCLFLYNINTHQYFPRWLKENKHKHIGLYE